MKESSTFSFRKSEPSTSQEQAVTTLIEKKGRDQRFIKNCLKNLNVDLKLPLRCWAKRLKESLVKLSILISDCVH